MAGATVAKLRRMLRSRGRADGRNIRDHIGDRLHGIDRFIMTY